MQFKKISKEAPRFFAWAALMTCSLIIKVLPSRFLYGFSAVLGRVFHIIALKHRRVAMDSLRIAFGKEKDNGELKKICRDCFISIAKSGAEILKLTVDHAYMAGRVEIEGREYLDRALAAGRGVILVSAHFGNFPLLISKLDVDGYRIGVIMRRMRDIRMERFLIRKRSKFGMRVIYSQPRQACVGETLRALRSNEMVFIPMDQNFGTAGVFVDFFGKKAATATGPVVLAQRTGSAIVPCFIVRQSDNTHRIIFEPQMALPEGPDCIAESVQNITAVIEAYIRRYPSEWGWMHKRWKARPAGETAG
ncbi:MAG: lysophospholipid acyltransferase family protein [Elusimicrobia bacterium]|nr:lysophospholipid acyltransferase family protein [Elusimicrobiota bacterium]